MALMLRMAGIPARVASGFSPGSYNKDSGEYRVRDLDAHSWVEVYFTGIGWVPFDPTPSAAPAESQSNGDRGHERGARRRRRGACTARRRGAAASERGTDTGAAGAAATAAAAGCCWLLPAGRWRWRPPALLLARRVRRRARSTPEQRADAQLRELRRALERLGWEVPADDDAARARAAARPQRRARPPRATSPRCGRTATIRARRRRPSRAERRALRRDAGRAAAGARARLRGLLALPPGGPRPA